LEEDQKDLYTEESDSEELRDTASAGLREKSSDESTESSEKMANWW